MTITRVWRRSSANRMISGVCGGLAEIFGIDVSLLRAGWVLFFLIGGAGGLLYLALWGILPDQAGERTSFPWLLFALAIGLFLLYATISLSMGLPSVFFD